MSGSNPQYPPQTGAYKVCVKNGAGWQDFDMCRLQISVGMDYHEGEKFKATLDWAKNRFKQTIICVNDTLQRFNIMHTQSVTEQEAIKKTLKQGDEWINRNCADIDNDQHLICRWNDWKKNSQYDELRRKVDQLYETNDKFRNAINDEINSFWSRQEKNENEKFLNSGFESFKSSSRQYLLEETAAFLLMDKMTDAVDVYPGSILLPFRVFKDTGADGVVGAFAHHNFTRIDFLRNSSFEEHKVAA